MGSWEEKISRGGPGQKNVNQILRSGLTVTADQSMLGKLTAFAKQLDVLVIF